jgi:hypothetical protein
VVVHKNCIDTHIYIFFFKELYVFCLSILSLAKLLDNGLNGLFDPTQA